MLVNLLNAKEAAAVAGLHPVYFRRLLAAGRGPITAQRGGAGRTAPRLFERAEIERWARTRCGAQKTSAEV